MLRPACMSQQPNNQLTSANGIYMHFRILCPQRKLNTLVIIRHKLFCQDSKTAISASHAVFLSAIKGTHCLQKDHFYPEMYLFIAIKFVFNIHLCVILISLSPLPSSCFYSKVCTLSSYQIPLLIATRYTVLYSRKLSRGNLL